MSQRNNHLQTLLKNLVTGDIGLQIGSHMLIVSWICLCVPLSCSSSPYPYRIMTQPCTYSLQTYPHLHHQFNILCIHHVFSSNGNGTFLSHCPRVEIPCAATEVQRIGAQIPTFQIISFSLNHSVLICKKWVIIPTRHGFVKPAMMSTTIQYTGVFYHLPKFLPTGRLQARVMWKLPST